MNTITRLFEILDQYHQKYPNQNQALAAKVNGKWKTWTIAEYVENANLFSYGLLQLGYKKGDKIGIITNNRPEWNFTDMGMQQIGVVNVPVYPTISDDDLKFIMNDSGVRSIIVANKDLYDKVAKLKPEMPLVEEVYSFNEINGVKHWTEITQLGKVNQKPDEVKAIRATIEKDHLATLLYTSGTTGTPKGVMLTHYNFVSNVIYSAERVPATPGQDKALSFLPINHVYERMLTYLYQYLGLQIWYAESLETIGDNLKEVKPEVFSTVPRLLEKVYDKIIGKGKELTGIKRALFFWAVDLGLKYELWGKNGWWYETQLKLANKLIFSKWREALGGNVKAIVSGGAALQPRLARIFWAAQIPVLEGYGLTETSPVIAVNYLATQDVAFGTVGPVLRDHEIKIAEDGEILAKGPNIMIGYYNRPDATAEVIDKDGYFHTGDIGELVDGKYLKITDRKKEIFKTSGGKYIAPQVIENKLKESMFIEQAMVIGENQKYASALIVPSFEFLQKWCEHKEIPFTKASEIIKNQVIKDRIMEEIEQVNKGLGKFETIKQIILLPELFSIEKGEMTPKLSLRRKIIMQNNKAAIDELYAQA